MRRDEKMAAIEREKEELNKQVQYTKLCSFHKCVCWCVCVCGGGCECVGGCVGGCVCVCVGV